MKKKVNRTLSLLMSLIMLAGIISVPMTASAADPNVQFTVSNATGAVGDVVEIKIDIAGAPYNVGSADIRMFFDNTKLEFVPPGAPAPDTYKYIENSYVSAGNTPQVGTTVEGRLKIAFATGSGFTGEGTFLHAKFRILPGFTGPSPVTLTIDEVTDVESGDIYDTSVINGTVSLAVAASYTITWDAANSTTPTTETVAEGVVPTAPVVTRDGYNFVEWSPAIVAATENTTYTAVWAAIVMSTISFDSKLGTTVEPITGEVGTPVTPPDDPTRVGYTFMGWDPSLPQNFPEGGLATSAMWQAIEYEITFDAAGGVGGEVQTVGYDATPVPPTVTREGYTFVEWTPAVTFVTEPATYTAVWEEIPAVTYQITFDANGGVGGDVQTVAEGDFPVTPADPTRDGYDFMGWDPEVIVVATENATYSAVWEAVPVLYSIIFDDNGGFGGENQLVLEGVVPTAPIVIKDGFDFVRWDPEVIVAATENTTYTAVWEALPVLYSINFDANGGVGGNVQRVAEGDFPTIPADPTREGYTFMGWDPEVIVAATENTTYTAVWEKIPTVTYQIYFDAHGGIGGETQTVEEGVVPIAPVVTRDGYNFLGWEPAIIAPATQSAVYIAQWEEIVFTTITFNTAGGSLIDPITGEVSSLVTPPADPTREGYDFIGWVDAIPTVFPALNLEVTAQWQIKQYTITFDANGGIGGDVQTVSHGTTPVAPADPTRDGYTFDGWTPVIVAATVDATYTAVWEEIPVVTYQISFDANGGMGSEVQTVEEGVVPTAPVVTRDGYNFLGWEPAVAAATANATYVAQWEVDPTSTYTITFDTNDGEEATTQTVDEGAMPLVPADPMRLNHVFLGWTPEVVAATEDATYTAMWLGDIDGDGSISVIDALMALQSNTGAITLTPEQFEAADVNRDGRVSALDALMIIHFVSGRLPSFPSPVAV